MGSETIFIGILIQTWGDIQEEDYRQRGERRELTGDRWVKAIVLETFSLLQILWKVRNEIIHGKIQET